MVEVVGKEAGKTLVHADGNKAVLPPPEKALVNQQMVGSCMKGGIDEGQAGGHDSHEPLDFDPTFHLQAIGSVVFEGRGLQQAIQCSEQVRAGDRGSREWWVHGEKDRGLENKKGC